MIPPHLKEAAEELKGRYIKSLTMSGVYRITKVLAVYQKPNGGFEITVDIENELRHLRLPALRIQVNIFIDSDQYKIESPQLMTELEVVKWRMTS